MENAMKRLFNLFAIIALLVLNFGAAGVTPAYAAGEIIFNYTGAEQTYIVPAGACTVTVAASGARGGGDWSVGSGSQVNATIPVTPSETLYIYVGGEGGYGGSGGFNGGGNGGSGYGDGGGGGGASDIRQGGNALTNRVIVAGGGGGAGGGDWNYHYGGGGGNGDGGNGWRYYGYPDYEIYGGNGGSGGSGGNGGNGGSGGSGIYGGNTGSNGSSNLGGSGGSAISYAGGGGGGGGGFYGGGGGGAGGHDSSDSTGSGGGGGGGSNLVPPGGWSISSYEYDGLVTITPNICPTVAGITPSDGYTTGGAAVTITGTYFTGATSVTIGGAAATGVTVVNDTTITATTPTGTAGARDVVVTTPGGSGTGTGLFTYTVAAYTGPIFYVKPGGTGNCSSWSTACELQTALTGADSGDEVWVAAGTYKPHASDRAISFNLESGVEIYGGFPNTGDPAWVDRDPATNVTILSGDIDNNDTNADGNNIAETTTDIQGDNSIHVVASATGGTLDGFTVTAGNANGASNAGGGMYNASGSSPTVTNVTFSGNSAEFGGGMYNASGSNPTVTNVTFSGNSARGYGWGGGMLNSSSSNSTVTNVTFSGNSAVAGGGMYNWNARNLTVTNVTFSGNSASYFGGGMYNSDSYPILKNVIIANSVIGGDCYNDDSLLNALSANNLIEDSAYACGLADGNNGNIIGKAPLLDPLGLGDHGGSTQTIPLLSGSPTLGAGDAATCAASPVNNLDQRGQARPQGDPVCDIGAYESNILTSYTVTFNAQGGSPTPANQSVALGGLVSDPGNPSLAGYTFNGWFTAPSGGSQWNFASDTMAGDMTLTAQWTANPTHTVTYDLNGGTGTTPTQAAVSEGASFTVADGTGFSNAGFTFNGWKDQTNASYAAGSSYTMGASNVTLTAQWTAVTVDHTVTFLANRGSGSMSPQTASSSAALTLNAFTRTGYAFSGWNTAANGTGMAYADGAVYDFSADLTLYAQWITATKNTLLLKPDFGGAYVMPYPWSVMGVQPPFTSLLDCNIFRSKPCSVRLIGGKGVNMVILQRVKLAGKAGDTFSFGLFNRASNVPTSSGRFQVEVLFYDSWNKIAGTTVLKLPTGSHNWMIYSSTATAPADYTHMLFRFIYQKSGGTAWFDDAFLSKLP
jgi:uncharacterized repeat protein (TIGR02543 family)